MAQLIRHYYLGSITHLVNSSGVVQQELSNDAWGRLRNPSNQQVYLPGNEPELFLGRGYTGHEHLPMFGLINMNARLYDPAITAGVSATSLGMGTDWRYNIRWSTAAGSYKFADNMAKPFRIASGVFGMYGMIRSVDDHRQGRISVAEATGDVLFGLASIYSGFWGGIANGSYVLGKKYGPNKYKLTFTSTKNRRRKT